MKREYESAKYRYQSDCANPEAFTLPVKVLTPKANDFELIALISGHKQHKNRLDREKKRSSQSSRESGKPQIPGWLKNKGHSDFLSKSEYPFGKIR